MNARLKLATGSQQEFNIASSELRRIADATQSPLESMVTLYGRISRPLKEAGRRQADILKVTEAVAQSIPHTASARVDLEADGSYVTEAARQRYKPFDRYETRRDGMHVDSERGVAANSRRLRNLSDRQRAIVKPRLSHGVYAS